MTDWSPECLEVLRLLSEHRNVLIRGAPGTGKTFLLSEVAEAFEAKASGPIHDPKGPVPIPSGTVTGTGTAGLPSPDRKARKVFRTVFHQNSKHREFITGLIPAPGLGGTTQFTVVEGTLFRASEHAKKGDGVALLIIDEINRGPAVQLFGGAIVSMEPDKRLGTDGATRRTSYPFELLSPSTGKTEEYYLPEHLYTLAAMNEADTSVEPLDVAFLRRWAHFQLAPNQAIVRRFFSLPEKAPAVLPTSANSVSDLYEVAVGAWSAVNDRIRLGRGKEFQLGHGVLMPSASPPTTVPAALTYLAGCWSTIRAHVDEVFFADLRSIAAVLGVGMAGGKAHPISLVELLFADDVRFELNEPDLPGEDSVFAVMRAVASAGTA
jgi:5-methylcytosine-specific restriction protein B